jgi:CCR4-NOT transcription complex subunit 6
MAAPRAFGRVPTATEEPPAKVPRLQPVVHRLRLCGTPLVVGVEILPRLMLLHAPQDQFVARWLRRARHGGEADIAVGNELAYTPTEADEAHRLRVEVTPLDAAGQPLAHACVAVESPSCVRDVFEPALTRARVPRPADGACGVRLARVLTYNILAQGVATPGFYAHCPEWALRWRFRRRLVLRELVASGADVLCLQEVEADAFEADLEPALSAAGYAAVFAPRRARRVGSTHGCATAFLRSEWSCEAQRISPLAELLPAAAAHLPPALYDEVKGKHNVVLLTALRARRGAALGGARGLLVANSHLHWEPSQPQLKAVQAQLLCCAARDFRADLGGGREAWPLVLAADMNATPTVQHAGALVGGGVYELLRTGALEPSHPHHPTHARAPPRDQGRAVVATGAAGPAAARGTDGAAAAPASKLALPPPPPLVQPLALESAYASVLGHEPWCSNFTTGFVGTLDYIWLEREWLAAADVLDVPVAAELAAHTALPSCVHPSDHLPLVATIHLRRQVAQAAACVDSAPAAVSKLEDERPGL